MCSPAARSRCPDSEARPPLAGCTCSPAASSAAVSGCCASQSISSPGTRARSSRAIAMSRRAWPRPIGEDTKSARRGRSGARVQRRCPTGRAPSTRAANSSISTFTFTGSRAFSPWPDPSSTTSSPPVSSATRRPRSSGVMRSRSPWIASTGQRTPDSSFSACSRVISAAGESFVCSSTERPASSAQPTQSSICFSEWGSGNISRNQNSAKPGKSRRHEARVKRAQPSSWPGSSSKGCSSHHGWSGVSAGTVGASAITPATRSGCSAAVYSAVAAPSDSPATSARSVPRGVEHRHGVPDVAAVERRVLRPARAPAAARVERDHAEPARQIRHLGLPVARADDRPGGREQDRARAAPEDLVADPDPVDLDAALDLRLERSHRDRFCSRPR